LSFLTALQLLTIIPVRREFAPERLGRSIAYFPVVGIIIGLILAGLSWLLGLFLPSAIVNALLIVFMVVVSGALHLDGFVDTCPYCHAIYDAKQGAAAATVGRKLSISVFYYTQLLGIALGIEQEKLGLHLNRSGVSKFNL